MIVFISSPQISCKIKIIKVIGHLQEKINFTA
jgi:hypothetical protein